MADEDLIDYDEDEETTTGGGADGASKK